MCLRQEWPELHEGLVVAKLKRPVRVQRARLPLHPETWRLRLGGQRLRALGTGHSE